MGISDGEWVSIRKMIESFFAKKGEYFATGKVIKRDPDNMLIWVAEFGDQPIPIVAFNYRLKYYDTDETGVVQRKYSDTEVLTPDVGDVVIIARELGVNRLPRCLGILQGRNWIDPTEG